MKMPEFVGSCIRKTLGNKHRYHRSAKTGRLGRICWPGINCSKIDCDERIHSGSSAELPEIIRVRMLSRSHLITNLSAVPNQRTSHTSLQHHPLILRVRGIRNRGTEARISRTCIILVLELPPDRPKCRHRSLFMHQGDGT
jgi:hypothetical protein